MKTHDLKTVPPYFDDVAGGAKTFEVRRDDRGFAVGDVLRLREWAPVPGRGLGDYTGREVFRRVTYVLRDYPEVAEGFVVMGVKKASADDCLDCFSCGRMIDGHNPRCMCVEKCITCCDFERDVHE